MEPILKIDTDRVYRELEMKENLIEYIQKNYGIKNYPGAGEIIIGYLIEDIDKMIKNKKKK